MGRTTSFGKSVVKSGNNRASSVLLGSPIVATDNRIVTSTNLTNAAKTIAAQPDVPRNLTVTVTDTTASITAGTVTIVGQDIFGETLTEEFSFSSFVSGTAKVGTKIFAKVDSVTPSGFTVLGGSGDELIKVGVGTVIGLPSDIKSSSSIKHVYLGGTRIASPTVATGHSKSGVDASTGTYNGSKLLHVIYSSGQ